MTIKSANNHVVLYLASEGQRKSVAHALELVEQMPRVLVAAFDSDSAAASFKSDLCHRLLFDISNAYEILEEMQPQVLLDLVQGEVKESIDC